MVLCRGCGFNIEQKDGRNNNVYDPVMERYHCDTCIKCDACPDMRESYRRGFNAGIEMFGDRIWSVAINMRRGE